MDFKTHNDEEPNVLDHPEYSKQSCRPGIALLEDVFHSGKQKEQLTRRRPSAALKSIANPTTFLLRLYDSITTTAPLIEDTCQIYKLPQSM